MFAAQAPMGVTARTARVGMINTRTRMHTVADPTFVVGSPLMGWALFSLRPSSALLDEQRNQRTPNRQTVNLRKPVYHTVRSGFQPLHLGSPVGHPNLNPHRRGGT